MDEGAVSPSPAIQLLLVPPVLNPATAAQTSYFTPVGLHALLSSLRESGITCRIYKPHLSIYDDEDFRKVAMDVLRHSAAAIGFSTWCDSFPYSVLIGEEIRKIDPGIPVIFGGPQASALGAIALREFSFIDYIIRGEADRSLPHLMKVLCNGLSSATENGRGPIAGKNHDSTPVAERSSETELQKIEGLLYRDGNGEVIEGKPAGVIPDLDDLPVPRYEELSQSGMVRIDAGRGCPFRCTFCSTNTFFSKKYRVKSPERLLEEFEYCNRHLGTSWIGISHDMFTLRKNFIEDFSRSLIRLNRAGENKYSWSCSARTDCITETLLDLMAESGCRAVFYGMETGSARIQKEIRKNLDPESAMDIIRHSAQLGIFTVVSYILGLPGESPEELNLTLRSAITVTLLGARPQLTLLSLVPGTPLYRDNLDKLEYDGKHSGFSLIYPTPKIDALIQEHPDIFSSFYHLPNKNIIRETYLFIAEASSFLENFVPTAVLIRDYLERDLPGFDLHQHCADLRDEYKMGEERIFGGLFFLCDSIRDYLISLEKEGLPGYVRDVFHFDYTGAFMIAKYKHWHMIRPENGAGGGDGRLPMDGRIQIRPYWKIIETSHYIYDYLTDPVGRVNKSRFRRGTYHYLVLPVSPRFVDYCKIPRKELPVYGASEGSTLREIVMKNKAFMEEDRILHIIRRMNRLGLVDIVTNDAPALQDHEKAGAPVDHFRRPPDQFNGPA